MRIKISSIEVMLLCLTFFEFTIVPHMVFLAFKYAVIIVLFFKHINKVKEMPKLMLLVFMYAGVVVISSILNLMRFNTVVASAFYGLHIATIYCVTKSYIEQSSLMKFVNILFYLLFCILFFNDIAMAFIKYNFNNPGEIYLVGNKFSVSFLHIFELALLFAKFTNAVCFRNGKIALSPKNMLTIVMASIFVFFICLKVTCTTGLIATATLVALFLAPIKIKLVASLRLSPLLFIAVANILVFGTFDLFRTNAFQSLITDVLGKSSNITGRFQIWAIIFDLIREKPILGYGYYSGIIASILNYGNPQNGVLKFLIDTGIVGLTLYILIVYSSLGKIKKDKLKEVFPFIAFLYSALVASLVEINLTDMTVFMSLAIIFVLLNKYSAKVNLQ